MNRRFTPSLIALTSILSLSLAASDDVSINPRAVLERSRVPRWQQERIIRQFTGFRGRGGGNGGSKDLMRRFMQWESTSKKARAQKERARAYA